MSRYICNDVRKEAGKKNEILPEPLWSALGPVPAVGVDWLDKVQSKSSFKLCCQQHKFLSSKKHCVSSMSEINNKQCRSHSKWYLEVKCQFKLNDLAQNHYRDGHNPPFVDLALNAFSTLLCFTKVQKNSPFLSLYSKK